ncbi:prolyl aminopeptidase [Candidatus Gracilibacteria bacterium]|nr:prolyl aminopeptidase [Candidatus Gracilibacteria bacterium]
MKTLYPKIETNQTGMLKVSDIHTVYWEESGNPDGKPVIFVHGGPGGGVSPETRRFFDPEKYRIIQFDQRGCGKSTPHACLEENTTWDLIDDMEKIRELLGVEKWMVFGGSWGSTLSLAYAQKHPNRVTELVLRGIFLLRQKELQWFYQNGASAIFPDFWEEYVSFIPKEEQGDLMKAYQKRLLGDDKEVQLEAARRWSVWEGSTCHLFPDEKQIAETGDANFALAFARIENHYFMNKGFFESENQILENIDSIRHIPTVIVQGRYDVVCPMQTAWELHKKFPEAQFVLCKNSGHSAFEPEIVSELVDATDRFAG